MHYIISVDGGFDSSLKLHAFLVNAESIDGAYDIFWKQCIHEKTNSYRFYELFVAIPIGGKEPPLTRNEFACDNNKIDAKFRDYYEHWGTPPSQRKYNPGSIHIKITKLPRITKNSFRAIKI